MTNYVVDGTVTGLSSEALTNPSLQGSVAVGRATDLVGFYGVTPVAQAAAITAITVTQPTLTQFGFTTTAQFNNLIAAVNSIITALTNIGVI